MTTATLIDTAKWPLTQREKQIFSALASGAKVSRKTLQEEALGVRFASPSMVPTHINRIRAKVAGELVITCEDGFYTMRPVNG